MSAPQTFFKQVETKPDLDTQITVAAEETKKLVGTVEKVVSSHPANAEYQKAGDSFSHLAKAIQAHVQAVAALELAKAPGNEAEAVSKTTLKQPR